MNKFVQLGFVILGSAKEKSNEFFERVNKINNEIKVISCLASCLLIVDIAQVNSLQKQRFMWKLVIAVSVVGV